MAGAKIFLYSEWMTEAGSEGHSRNLPPAAKIFLYSEWMTEGVEPCFRYDPKSLCGPFRSPHTVQKRTVYKFPIVL